MDKEQIMRGKRVSKRGSGRAGWRGRVLGALATYGARGGLGLLRPRDAGATRPAQTWTRFCPRKNKQLALPEWKRSTIVDLPPETI